MSYMLKSPQLAARFSLGNSCEVGFPSKRFAVTCDCPPTSCHAQLLHGLLCSAHAMINAWPSVCHKLIRTTGITKLRGIAGISAKTAQGFLRLCWLCASQCPTVANNCMRNFCRCFFFHKETFPTEGKPGSLEAAARTSIGMARFPRHAEMLCMTWCPHPAFT